MSLETLRELYKTATPEQREAIEKCFIDIIMFGEIWPVTLERVEKLYEVA